MKKFGGMAAFGVSAAALRSVSEVVHHFEYRVRARDVGTSGTAFILFVWEKQSQEAHGKDIYPTLDDRNSPWPYIPKRWQYSLVYTT